MAWRNASSLDGEYFRVRIFSIFSGEENRGFVKNFFNQLMHDYANAETVCSLCSNLIHNYTDEKTDYYNVFLWT